MRPIDADFVKQKMNQTMDYQDLYLPIHFEQVLDDAPTISPDEVGGVGEWEHQELAPTNWTFCSVCGRQRSKKYKWYYCPNCGARMSSAEAEKAMEVSG